MKVQGYLRPCRLQQRWILNQGRKVDEGDSLDPGDIVADPLVDARVLSVQRNLVGDRRREFRNAVPELVQSPLLDGLFQALVPSCGAANL